VTLPLDRLPLLSAINEWQDDDAASTVPDGIEPGSIGTLSLAIDRASTRP
jgi:hypothetical protein